MVQFDGTSDYFINETVNYTARTAIAVFRVDSALRNTNYLGQIWGQYDRGHIANDYRNLDTGGSYWSFDGSGGAMALFALDGADFTTYHVGNSSLQPWSDDTVHLVTAQYRSDLSIDTRHTIGSMIWSSGSHFFGGQIAEVLVFNFPLSSQERAGLEYMMAERWGFFGPAVATQDQIDAANALFPDNEYYVPKGTLLLFN
ncbi:MAG: hypothetical protein R6V06_01250 [Kiritimatiellia bacterium]